MVKARIMRFLLKSRPSLYYFSHRNLMMIMMMFDENRTSTNMQYVPSTNWISGIIQYSSGLFSFIIYKTSFSDQAGWAFGEKAASPLRPLPTS